MPCARKPNPRVYCRSAEQDERLFSSNVFSFTMREEFIIRAAPGDFSMSFL